MAYFKIGDNDYSSLVNSLKITHRSVYNAQTNANGDSVVDLVNTKREIEVGIIPLNAVQMASLLSDIDKFNVSISYRNPRTGGLEENVNCIIPDDSIEYYTIQANKVLCKAFTLTFTEL